MQYPCSTNARKARARCRCHGAGAEAASLHRHPARAACFAALSMRQRGCAAHALAARRKRAACRRHLPLGACGSVPAACSAAPPAAPHLALPHVVATEQELAVQIGGLNGVQVNLQVCTAADLKATCWPGIEGRRACAGVVSVTVCTYRYVQAHVVLPHGLDALFSPLQCS